VRISHLSGMSISSYTEVYSVWFKLRLKYVNRTHKTLILDREIGKAWYGEKVAKNLDDLIAGKYEYNPNIDWFFSDKAKLSLGNSKVL
jgi:hypothetical protein